jgi:hypothetical protein
MGPLQSAHSQLLARGHTAVYACTYITELKTDKHTATSDPITQRLRTNSFTGDVIHRFQINCVSDRGVHGNGYGTLTGVYVVMAAAHSQRCTWGWLRHTDRGVRGDGYGKLTGVYMVMAAACSQGCTWWWLRHAHRGVHGDGYGKLTGVYMVMAAACSQECTWGWLRHADRGVHGDGFGKLRGVYVVMATTRWNGIIWLVTFVSPGPLQFTANSDSKQPVVFCACGLP